MRASLDRPEEQFVRGPVSLFSKGIEHDDRAAFVVEDGKYVSGRWPGRCLFAGEAPHGASVRGHVGGAKTAAGSHQKQQRFKEKIRNSSVQPLLLRASVLKTTVQLKAWRPRGGAPQWCPPGELAAPVNGT